MPDYNLEGPTVLRIALIFLVGLTSAPFLVALALWQATRLLRFKNPSYARALVSVLATLAATLVIEALLFHLGVMNRPEHVLRESWIVLAVALGTGLIAGVVAVAKLFDESAWKSLAAVILQTLSGALLFAVVIGAMVYTALSHTRIPRP